MDRVTYEYKNGTTDNELTAHSKSHGLPVVEVRQSHCECGDSRCTWGFKSKKILVPCTACPKLLKARDICCCNGNTYQMDSVRNAFCKDCHKVM